MTRPVSLETLEAREHEARRRLNQQRRTVARLQRQAVQTEKAARLARWCALGEAVEALCGPLTPAQLAEVVRSLPLSSRFPLTQDMRDTSFPLRETINPEACPPEGADRLAPASQHQRARASLDPTVTECT